MSASIVVAGYFFYQNFRKHFQRETERQMAAIADLKVNELTEWRRERLGDAAIFYKNAYFTALIRRYFEQPADMETQKQIRTWLSHFQAASQYDRIMLLDSRYINKIIIPEGAERSVSFVSPSSDASLRLGKVVLQDFYWYEQKQKIYLKILVPIFDRQDSKELLAVLTLRIDPATYLYPFIQRWPTPSNTAETLLVRRDGSDVLYLNELKFQKNSALKLRIPLSNKNVPAVEAVLGQEGIVEGFDYRGVPVLAALRAVPSSNWFLVARLDKAEVFAPLRERMRMIIILIAVLLLGFGAGFRLVALRDNEKKFRTLFETMVQGVVYQDADGYIISANHAAELILGLTLEQLLGRVSKDPRWKAIHEDGSDFPGDTHPAMDALRTGKEVRNTIMGVYHPDKNEYVWISINAIPQFKQGNTKPYQVYTTFEDISERKHSEAEQKRLIGELESALKNIKTLRGLVPICAGCKKIRDDQGYWDQVEIFIQKHSEAQFTHSLCPECIKKYYPDENQDNDVS
jgi:PAS domain S-box-containing protein